MSEEDQQRIERNAKVFCERWPHYLFVPLGSLHFVAQVYKLDDKEGLRQPSLDKALDYFWAATFDAGKLAGYGYVGYHLFRHLNG